MLGRFELLDEVELYDLNARYYDPSIARFLTEDPYYNLGNRVMGVYEINVPDVYSIMQANALYAYCGNNSVIFVDPSGYWQEGDENLSPEAQVYIKYYTQKYNEYDDIYQTTDDEETKEQALADREKMHEKADDIRALDAEGKITGIYYDVPIYSQGDLKLCWAYCQVMAEDYHEGRVRTQESADKRAKEIAVDLHGWFNFEDGFDAWNNGGNPKNLGDSIYIGKFSDLQEALSEGPLYASYRDGTGPDSKGHAILITGAVTVPKHPALVTTNNPWGKKNINTYHDFKKQIPGDDDNKHKMKLYSIYKFEWGDSE